VPHGKLQGGESKHRGNEGRNGLVRDVNDIKNSGKWMKAIAGTGFIGGVSKWLHELYK
jgi:hypothetical protein